MVAGAPGAVQPVHKPSTNIVSLQPAAFFTNCFLASPGDPQGDDRTIFRVMGGRSHGEAVDEHNNSDLRPGKRSKLAGARDRCDDRTRGSWCECPKHVWPDQFIRARHSHRSNDGSLTQLTSHYPLPHISAKIETLCKAGEPLQTQFGGFRSRGDGDRGWSAPEGRKSSRIKGRMPAE